MAVKTVTYDDEHYQLVPKETNAAMRVAFHNNKTPSDTWVGVLAAAAQSKCGEETVPPIQGYLKAWFDEAGNQLLRVDRGDTVDSWMPANTTVIPLGPIIPVNLYAADVSELANEIHCLLKDNPNQESHGLLGNLHCIRDTLQFARDQANAIMGYVEQLLSDSTEAIKH